ncbi:MAG: hypothetical protein EBR81_14290 [Proteobacteria bacterium]|nr:hypothetical protein [Pseudomonadota bacterium]
MESELRSLHGLNKPKQGDSSSERLLVEKRKGERPMTAPFFIKFVHPALLSKGKNSSLGTLLIPSLSVLWLIQRPQHLGPRSPSSAMVA